MSNRLNWSQHGCKTYMVRNIYSTYTMSQGQVNNLDAEPHTASGNNEIVSYAQYISINFPRPVYIDKFAVLGSVNKNYYAEVSADTDETSRPGDYGTWAQVGFTDPFANAWEYTEIDMHTPTPTRWLRIRVDRWNFTTYCLHLFGNYVDSLFELYDQGGTLITDPKWMDWSIAYSDTNWVEDKIFKIKNNDTVSRTYNITVDQQQTADVVFVTDHFKVSNGVDNDVTTLTTASVAPGAFSEDITVTGNISILDNPLGGLYYPKVTVDEVQI